MSSPPESPQIAIIGAGRVGRAVAVGLRHHVGHQVVGPLTRSYGTAQLSESEIVLLCVPDREIEAAAATLAERMGEHSALGDGGDLDRCGGSGLTVGHCSGATTLSVLEPFVDRFSLHPLMTFTDGKASLEGSAIGCLRGAFAALAGSTPRARAGAQRLASALGLATFVVEERDRAAYHAAASMASNFLVTLEVAAARLAASAGCKRESLVPLVRQTVENWAVAGSDALTGPVVRGDNATVARQRDAIAERTPELLGLFDAMIAATCDLVRAQRS